PKRLEAKWLTKLKAPSGVTAAKAVEDMLAHGHESGKGTAAAVLGIITLLFGAAGVFGQLQDALNTVWKVAPKPGRGLMGMIRDRFLSLTMVLGTGFLLLVSLILTAALSTLSAFFSHYFSVSPIVWQIVNQVVAFGVITLLFAMIFRLLPDAQIAWRDV